MATTDQSAVVGIFQSNAAAELAIAELKKLGFRSDQIESAARDERVIVTVWAADRENDALDILRRNGAIEANSRFGQDTDPNFMASSRTTDVNPHADTNQPVEPGATASFYERPLPSGTPGVPETPFQQESQDDPGTAHEPDILHP